MRAGGVGSPEGQGVVKPQRDPWAFNRTQGPLLGRCGVVDACPCITGLATVRHSVNCIAYRSVGSSKRAIQSDRF